FFFFDVHTPINYFTLSLHDALPISLREKCPCCLYFLNHWRSVVAYTFGNERAGAKPTTFLITFANIGVWETKLYKGATNDPKRWDLVKFAINLDRKGAPLAS